MSFAPNPVPSVPEVAAAIPTPAPAPEVAAPQVVYVPAPSAPTPAGSGLPYGAVLGAALGGALISLAHTYLHVDISGVNEFLLGGGVLSVGSGVGHVVAKKGLIGLFSGLLHGWEK